MEQAAVASALADLEGLGARSFDADSCDCIQALIERALHKCGNVKTKAADFLGINRNTLNKKVKDDTKALQSDAGKAGLAILAVVVGVGVLVFVLAFYALRQAFIRRSGGLGFR
jgi:hypothetical protein